MQRAKAQDAVLRIAGHGEFKHMGTGCQLQLAHFIDNIVGEPFVVFLAPGFGAEGLIANRSR